MMFPRLPALAEIAWSPRVRRTAHSAAYHDFLHRLAAQAPRLQAAGENFYVSPEVPWHLTLAAHRARRDQGTHTVNGTLATLSAPGVAKGSLDVTVLWQSGDRTPADVTGADPAGDRTNGLYRISASHTYTGRVPDAVTVRVRAPGMGTDRVRVPLR
jgi:hexosaminidase